MSKELISKPLSYYFIELAYSYIRDSQSSTFYVFYRNLSKNGYGLTETEYWMLFGREFDSFSENMICHSCMRRMCSRDMSWHRCKHNRIRDEDIVLNRFKIILRSLKLIRESILFSILVLKRILGRDLAVQIGKVLYSTRYDFPLWYRSIAPPVQPKKKVTNSRSKRLKDPKDFRWVL